MLKRTRIQTLGGYTEAFRRALREQRDRLIKAPASVVPSHSKTTLYDHDAFNIAFSKRK